MSHRFTRENSTISSGRSPCRSWPRGLVSPTLTWPTRAGRRSSSAHSRSEDLERRARHPTPPTVEGLVSYVCSHFAPITPRNRVERDEERRIIRQRGTFAAERLSCKIRGLPVTAVLYS